MSHRKWKGVLDVLDENDQLLSELGKAASEARGCVGDPVSLTSALQRIKTMAANARATNQAAITALARAADLK